MTITDEMVEKAYNIWLSHVDARKSLRAALKAVEPMLMTEKSAIAFLETKGWVFTDTEHLLQ